MEYIAKKTTEFTQAEKENYCRLFKEVLGRNFTLDDFATKYDSPVSGYSYHELMVDDGEIVGSNSIIPFHYDYYGTRTIFGLDLDTMIAKSHRGKDVMALKKMWQSAIPMMKADRVSVVFGFPNALAHPFWIKVNKWRTIAQLRYYMLPIRVSKLAKVPAALDVFSQAGCGLLNLLATAAPGDKTPLTFPIAKVQDAAFAAYRFGGFFKNYRTIELRSQGGVHYTIVDEDGTRAAYIIDVVPFSAHNLRQAVREIYRRERTAADAIIYVGHLPFTPLNLFEVPRKYEPAPQRLSFQILDDTVADERVSHVENWYINLAAYDVR